MTSRYKKTMVAGAVVGLSTAVYIIVGSFQGGMVFAAFSLFILIRQLRTSFHRSDTANTDTLDDLSYGPSMTEDDGASCISRRAVTGMLAALEQSNSDLRKSEERYRAYIEQSSEGVSRFEIEPPIPVNAPEEEQIHLLRQHACIAECNDTFARMFGFNDTGETLGKRIADVIGNAITDDNLVNVRAFIRSGYRLTDMEMQRVDRNGNTRYLTGHVVGIVENGYLVRVWGNFMDITRRKQIETKLQIQTSAINAASDQILITNPEGEIEFVNPAFERQTGYMLVEVLGKTPSILKSGKHDAYFYDNLWKTIKDGNTWRGEIVNRCKDGSLKTSDVTITPVMNDSGSVEHVIAIERDVTEKKIYEERLDHLAHHDVLTGLPNRLLFSDRLTQSLAHARRQQQSLAVMFLDLDRFKLINDTMGHNIGDLLLKAVAKRLTECLREVDTIARMGGDEFTIILHTADSEQSATEVAQRVLDAFNEPFVLDGLDLVITASIGISLYPSDGEDAESLVRNADTAMYLAKEVGRNNFQIYTEALNTAILERMILEKSLRKALEREEFIVHYQPRVNLSGEKIMGVEALVRWRHPELGLILPNRFIPLAEETGLIVPLTEFVLYEACTQNKAWQDAGLAVMDVAVNISAKHFQQGDLVETVKKVLEDTGLEARYLDLEITESSLMQNPDLAVKSLDELQAMGVRISIDDFGTGYSSLSYLKRFPIQTLKIDQSFVRDITSNTDDAAIAGAVVAMAHSLNLKVVAEGVETLGQLEFLRSLECDEMQGYFISSPVSSDEVTLLLETTEQKSRDNIKQAA